MIGYSLVPANIDEHDDCDNLLQSAYWAGVKGEFGFTAYTFRIASEKGENLVSALSRRPASSVFLLVLERRLPGGLTFAYIPHGPDILLPDENRQGFLVWLAGELRRHLPGRCVFIRFDLPWAIENPDDRTGCFDRPLLKATVDVQVPDTVVLDLESGEDEILSRMKAKTRYNIRLAERKGVIVRDGNVADLDLWYDMIRETARRDGITHHGREYFAALLNRAETTDRVQVKLLFAEVEGAPVAAIMITLCGSRCIYHFGASRTRSRNYMPTYALQWHGIRIAKEAGCTTYDLFGIPPVSDSSHPMHGLYRVKTGFGGEIVHRAGCWDFPLRSKMYRFLRLAETARKKFYAAG